MLVFLIKKRLSLHFRKTGKQIIKVPCSESQFVGVFGPWIQRYSPCKRKYTCLFKGENACETLSIILQDVEWGGRWYDLEQKAYVVLYISSSQEVGSNNDNKNKLPEMLVEWYNETIVDAHQHTVSTGFIRMKFCVDTVSYQAQR
jgi:hypothetical protein